MTYRAPVADIAFTLKHSAGLKSALEEGLYGDLTEDVVNAVLEEAGKFASTVIAPLNTVGDKHGTPLKDGKVTMPPGWKDAYTAWAQGGWNGLAASEQWGGQGLPHALNAACIEMWNSASMAFGIGPVLTMGAIEALDKHGTEALKQRYLAKLTTGEWMGTMQLTEPQAGSDVGALRTRAERAPDGSYRISGSKIFITYGEHDLTDNIIHFVLARLPDAPPGTAIDRATRAKDDAARKAGDQRASLLTPVAKAFSTDIGTEVASLGVQVHGGMGFIEDTGAAQHYRDARIAQIYEGTNGIQAIDLVTRKLPLAGGAAVGAYLDELRRSVAAVNAANDPAFGAAGTRLGEAVEQLARATTWLL